MTRPRSLRVGEPDESVLPRIQTLKAEPSFWEYRRIWAYLRFVEQHPVNKKRMWRLRQEQPLLVPPNLRLIAKRTPMRSKPQPTKPTEWWGIEMTKVRVEGVGWVDIVIVLAWYTKAVVGHYAGLRGTATHWLEALAMAVNRQSPHGARGQGVSLMSDTGCQPTSRAFKEVCSTLGVHQTCTSYNNPKGNADPECCMRTLKEECLWLQEWTCPCELIRALKHWLARYNEHYFHSALGY